jgi:hypothetical protein
MSDWLRRYPPGKVIEIVGLYLDEPNSMLSASDRGTCSLMVNHIRTLEAQLAESQARERWIHGDVEVPSHTGDIEIWWNGRIMAGRYNPATELFCAGHLEFLDCHWREIQPPSEPP